MLATVSLASLVAPLNSTMIAVALPDIRQDFGVGHDQVTWLVTAYLIAMAVAQPIGGRVGDQLGRARTVRFGLLLFLGLSFAAAAAPNFVLLVLLRTCQAVVGAAVIPNGMAMLRASVPPERLGRVMGISTAVLGLGAATGPLVGAALLELGSWRWLFFTNLAPVGLSLLCLQLLRYQDIRSERRLELDLSGAAALCGVLITLSFLLGSGLKANLGLDAVVVIGLGLMTVFFVQRQKRSATPVAEWSLFRNRSFAASTSYVLLSNLVMYTTLLAIPFFLKEVQGKSAGSAGLLLGAMSILMAVLAPLSGQLADMRGRRLPAVLGGCFQILATVMLVFGIAKDVSYGYLALSMALLGLGIGLGTGPATTAAVEAAPQELAGVASGTVSMMRYFGSIVGAAFLGNILSADAAAPDSDVFQVLFVILACISIVITVAANMIHQFVRADVSPTPVRLEPTSDST